MSTERFGTEPLPYPNRPAYSDVPDTSSVSSTVEPFITTSPSAGGQVGRQVGAIALRLIPAAVVAAFAAGCVPFLISMGAHTWPGAVGQVPDAVTVAVVAAGVSVAASLLGVVMILAVPMGLRFFRILIGLGAAVWILTAADHPGASWATWVVTILAVGIPAAAIASLTPAVSASMVAAIARYRGPTEEGTGI